MEVPRLRALPVLRGRFERRLTVLLAGPGFGKSTVIAQALAENAIERIGVDVVVAPEVLTGPVTDAIALVQGVLEGAARANGARTGVARLDPATLDPIDDGDVVTALIDLLRRAAPLDVVLVLDDAHRLPKEVWPEIERLLAGLPANGHLLVASRDRVPLPVSRLLAAGEAVVLGEHDLVFDDLELARWGIDRVSAPEWVREGWPVLVALHHVGTGADMEAYLRTEVIEPIGPDRCAVLAAVAGLGPVDGALVRAVTSGTIPGVDELVAGLPLVPRLAPGVVEVPGQWLALLDHDQPGLVRDLSCEVGHELRARDELARAAMAFARANAHHELEQVVGTLAHRPTMHTDVREISTILEVLPPPLRDGPSGQYLEAARYWASDERLARGLFVHVADRCRTAGDLEMEALARWRLVQYDDLDEAAGRGAGRHLPDLESIDHPLARSTAAWAHLRAEIGAGRPDRAVALLADLHAFGAAQRANLLAICMIDVGRPEGLPTTLERVLDAGLDDIYEAQAVWLQGAVDPTTAWSIAAGILGDRADSRSLTVQVSLLSVLATMALAAGDHETARHMADEAARNASEVPSTVGHFARVADALVALDAHEERGVAALEALVAVVPLGTWPERPYLYALCALRAFVAGGERLDALPLGPSLEVAVRAGAAVAAGRSGDAEPARELPWSNPTLLRVHVPPCLLVELAVLADHRQALATLDSIPDARRHLLRCDATTGHVGRVVARRLLSSMPVRPDYEVRVTTFGGMALERSDLVPTDGWDRRSRVRQLLAYLVVHGEVHRADVAADLWPDLPADRAAANLRVNLSHLATALQPDRDPGAPPWFLIAEADRVRLAGDGLSSDLADFDHAVREAVRCEAAGLPTEAIGHYLRVVELYRGSFLAELDGWWLEGERSRLRSCAHVATARLGELTLARGEPEQALALAVAARRLDPLSERARCLAISAHLALGSQSAARDEAAEAAGALARAGIEPGGDLRRLVRRVDHPG